MRRDALEQREYDPRREERRKATRIALPDDADPRLLDEEVRRELRSLSRETAELVSKHLVVTGQLLDEDPERALTHARAARALAGRIGVVRLAAGLAAYAAQEWAEALSELRAARRITGRPEHLAVMADCERALGRPERALAYGDDPEVTSLSQDERVELVIVLAGARRDMGQLDAAVLALQTPARATTAKRPWAVRLWYAFADALSAAGRDDEAREWFERTAELDDEGQTDATDRVLQLDGVVLDDLEDDGDDNGDDREDDAAPGMDDAALAAYVAEGFQVVPVKAEPEVEGAAEPIQTETVSRPQGVAVESSVARRPFSGDPELSLPVAAPRPAAALIPTFAAADGEGPAAHDDKRAPAEVDGAADRREEDQALEVAADRAVDHPAEDGDGELTLFS